MTQSRNIPLTARSVIASLLLGTDPPALPGLALVRAAGVLGAGEGATRVALSRMTATGELVAADGRYRLAGPALLDRRTRQNEGRRPAMRAWDGTWRVAVAGDGRRRPAAERAELRRQLAARRLAEWREGVWLRPDNLTVAPGPDGCLWLEGARPDADPVVLAGLWDVAGWATGARNLQAAMAAAQPELERGEGLPDAFRLAAGAIRHLGGDPLLPPELLPPDWPGASLRAAYDAFEAAFRAALVPYLRT